MPKILIVAATRFEVEPILNHYKIVLENDLSFFKSPIENISFLITGVGMVNTAFKLGQLSNEKYDFAINVGICGAFEQDLKIGEVVDIVSDTLSEMGAENDEEFIEYNNLNLGGTNVYRNRVNAEIKILRELKNVKSITVNTIHGNDQSIKRVKDLYLPDVESMEGAAFFRACEGLSDYYLQIRAVSNYVEKRDKSKWNIPLAIKNVNEFVIDLLQVINNK